MITQRTPFVGGNWKMNTNSQEGIGLVNAIEAGVDLDGVDVAVFPPFPYLRDIGSQIQNGTILGAQDLWYSDNGAFTGEVSTDMLSDCGAKAVLTGHSERRHVIGEPDELVNKKTKRALESGMLTVLCVGEKIEQRDAGQTDAVNERQIRAGLSGIIENQLDRVVIAYEPVWAIGTGKTATPDDAQEAHAKIRALIGSLYSSKAGESIRIIYGGSMKPSNAIELMAMPDIDGGLIGGASLNAGDFCSIIEAAKGSLVG